MREKWIDNFFKVLAEELKNPAQAILTGAAAGLILGQARPSMDIDFAIKLRRKSKNSFDDIDQAVQRAVKRTGIPANYAEDIDRWGMVTLLDYEQHATFYRKYKELTVLIMDPVYWSIGKITRYLESDTHDLRSVFKKKKVPWRRAIKVWGKALARSPRSTALRLFIDHARHFLNAHGKEIWGKKFKADQAMEQLLKFSILPTS